MKLRLILLDRDGVINEDSVDYVRSPSQWHPIPGSLEAIAKLGDAGLDVGVCTNQSGVARGLYSTATLDTIHAKMCAAIRRKGGRLSTLHYCPHHPDDGCQCRKPEPGMLLAAMRDVDAAPGETVFVGDSVRDVQAARAAGCQPVIVGTGNGIETKAQFPDVDAYDDLQAFCRWVTR